MNRSACKWYLKQVAFQLLQDVYYSCNTWAIVVVMFVLASTANERAHCVWFMLKRSNLFSLWQPPAQCADNAWFKIMSWNNRWKHLSDVGLAPWDAQKLWSHKDCLVSDKPHTATKELFIKLWYTISKALVSIQVMILSQKLCQKISLLWFP